MLSILDVRANHQIPLQELDLQDKQILQMVEFISRRLSNDGYSVIPYSQASLGKLVAFTPAQKQRACEQLEKLANIIDASHVTTQVEPNPDVESIHPEKNLVDRALNFYNFKLKDDFWKTVEHHDIIEIYNDEGIQLFRTFNFFETSGYSLTDLLTNEWYLLWERPKTILEAIFKYSQAVMAGELPGVTKMDVPKHIVKEIYKGFDDMCSFEPRSTFVEFSHVCPLYDKQENTDKVAGLVVSSKATRNTYGAEETKKLIIF